MTDTTKPDADTSTQPVSLADLREEDPKAVIDDPEPATGDFTDTDPQPDVPVDPATDDVVPEVLETGDVEPFTVPQGYRRAQKRDTTLFAIFALITIIVGFFALLLNNPFPTISVTFNGPTWVPLTTGIVFIVAGIAMLIFGFLSLVDTAKAERAYHSTTHAWVLTRYGLDLSKRRIKELGTNRQQLGGTTGWDVVKLEGYPQGVQVTYTERYGYRLITTVDGVESQLPRSGR